MIEPPPASPEPGPPAGPSDDAPLKLSGAAASLKGPRNQPARFSAPVLITIGSVSAMAIVAAIFVPNMLAKHPTKTADVNPAQTHTPLAVPPVDEMTYSSAGALNTTGGAAPDCGQTPGAPGCAPSGALAAGGLSAGGASGGQASQSGGAQGAAGGQGAGHGDVLTPLRGADGGARTSGLFFGGPLAQPVQVVEGAAERAKEGATTLLPPWPAPPPQKPPPPPAEVLAANGQGEKTSFLNSDTASPDYVNAKLQQPRSPYEVKAGSIIPAALLTAVNSDLPGEIVAQVTQPVFDHVSGRYVLIPQGARVIGRYDSQVAYGQTRALIVWHRIIFPNGQSINFGSMNATDATGASGVADKVDDHFGQLFKGIVLSTLLSVGASSAEDAQARSSGTLVVNSAESGLAQEAQNVGQRITDRDLNRQPTIVIRQGVQVRVLVDKDMILAPYQ